MSKLKKFIRNEKGAIAVETALLTPILIFALLRATDIALEVHASQQMSKAVKSGVQYVVAGGRDETSMAGIVKDSFSNTISEDAVQVKAYCGCITETPGANGSVEDAEIGGMYTKFETELSEDLCTSVCASDSEISKLIEISLTYETRGIFKSKDLVSRLQTRIQ